MATTAVQAVPKELSTKIIEKTPQKYIKTRPGRGGNRVQYVEGGYIISKLNELFNYLWDFDIVEEKLGKTQVTVKGKLTVHLTPELIISKTQYGGSDIKLTNQGQMVDYGDDLKAAATDALKKCASLFGIAQDVYWKSWEDEHGNPAPQIASSTPEPQSAYPDKFDMNSATEKQRNFIYGLLKQKGVDDVWLHKLILEQCGKKSVTELTLTDAKTVIDGLLLLPNAPQEQTGNDFYS